MVTITDYQTKKNQRGEQFVVLNLISDVVMEQSTNTGNWFANTYKANIVASFDEETAKLMIGKQLPGSIIKKECEPYEYVIKSTGKKKILTHTFEYVENGKNVYNDSRPLFDEFDGNPIF
jgi:hypothetical protein